MKRGSQERGNQVPQHLWGKVVRAGRPLSASGIVSIGCLVLATMLGCGEDEKTVHLIISDHDPAEAPPAVAAGFWAEHIAEQSGGRIEFEIHHDGELLGEKEVFKGIQTGVADIGYYVLDSVDGLMLNTVMSLPFMGWPDQRETSVLYDNLLDQFPAMREEWGELSVVAIAMMPGSHMHFKDVAVTNSSDLDGVKVMGAESLTAEAVEAAGAIPVALSITEMGTALDNGTIDGVINHFAVLKVFGVLEKMSSHLVFGEGGINMTPVYIVMNKNVLKNLDEDLQALLVNSGNIFRDKFFEIDSAFQEATRQEAIDGGHTITELTSEQVEDWRADIAQPVHDAWIAAAEAEGVPGQDIYDDVLNQLR